MGYEYRATSNGKTRNGYGVVANTIFSVMHNEDFSHDLFHYYSAKIRSNEENWYAEEGSEVTTEWTRRFQTTTTSNR
jgi:hypothetical protein